MKLGLLILTFALAVSCHSNRQENRDDYSDLPSKIDSIISKHKFNGVVLVSADSTVIYSKATGFSDLESRVGIDINDQFVIGSISKQITAVLVLREYEKGKIGLNDPIGQYLSEIDQPWTKQVTIHQLLTHTHGIVGLDKPLAFKEGSQFHYSQLGYELLAQILEKITEKTFETLSTQLFEEYGLKNTVHPESKKKTGAPGKRL